MRNPIAKFFHEELCFATSPSPVLSVRPTPGGFCRETFRSGILAKARSSTASPQAFRPNLGATVTAQSQRRWRLRFNLWHIVSVIFFLSLYLAMLRYELFVVLHVYALLIAVPLIFNPFTLIGYLYYRRIRRQQAAETEPGRGIIWLATTGVVHSDVGAGAGIRWLDSETSEKAERPRSLQPQPQVRPGIGSP
jgi:hypothetical protein